METWTVYILSCADKKIYTGCTNNFDDRILRHQARLVVSTKSRLPVAVSYDSFRLKFYNPETGTKDAVKNMLQKLQSYITRN